MRETAVHATTLREVVTHEFHWVDTLLAMGVDEYQLAYFLRAVIVRNPRYQNDIPVIVSDLKDCIRIQYLGTAA